MARRRTTKDDERRELPRCDACDRPVGEDAIHESGAEEEEPLVFCDERCREDYRLGLTLPAEERREDRAAG